MSWETAKNIIKEVVIGYMATDVGGQPRVRPMSFVLTEDNKLWSSTYRESGKIKELEQNPRVEICFLDSKYVQLRIAGTLDLSGGEDKKAKLLDMNPKVRNHFKEASDPKFVHMEITPTDVRFKPTGFSDYTKV